MRTLGNVVLAGFAACVASVAGADPRLQRAIAWWGGPPSFLGMVAMVSTLLPIFLD